MPTNAVSRRTAIKALGASGALTFLPWLSEESAQAFAALQATEAPPLLKVLTPAQYATVEALVEAIIPADERSPGAKEARVADYIDLALSDSEDALRQQFLEGLGLLDAEATARGGAPFAKLAPAQVEDCLAELARNEKPPEGVPATPLERFFVAAKHATIHGYYTSEIGIHKELRYKGNQLLAEFQGCHTEDGKDCPHCGQKPLPQAQPTAQR
ncbi:MAG TPA: gluconate 2-dehydrogenase subunit 3 family protein [Vicinamibacteria bacterium]|nr:gluconate 2-dehydrogenase subunit 3 family protein [Vicinamibacteria bacterium]